MTMLKLPLTWVLVADGQIAQAWECRDRTGMLSPVSDFVFEATETHGFSRDLKSDKPGRAFASVGAQRSMMEPHHDPHELAKVKFAHQVADHLDQAFRAGRFQQLIVIAPPRMLGALRGSYTPAVQTVLSGELAKDLVKSDKDAIWQQVRQFIEI